MSFDSRVEQFRAVYPNLFPTVDRSDYNPDYYNGLLKVARDQIEQTMFSDQLTGVLNRVIKILEAN